MGTKYLFWLIFTVLGTSIGCITNCSFSFSDSNSSNFLDILNQIECSCTHVFLIGGNFTIDQSVETKKFLNNIAYESLIFEAILCNENIKVNCYDQNSIPTINVGKSVIEFIILSNTIFKNIKFIHNFNEGDHCKNCFCCDYCRNIISKVGTTYRDDRNQTIKGEIMQEENCRQYNDLNFMNVYAELILENVEFLNFRMGFRSLIEINGGKVLLKSVNFINVLAKRAIILKISDSLLDSFVYEGGIIELVNNGYELNITYELGGFAFLSKINLVILKNLEFNRNFHQGSNDFIQLYYIETLKINNSSFHHNVVNTSLIRMDIHYYQGFYHTVEILDSSFYDNFINQSLLQSDDNNIQYFSIINCLFTNNIAANLISINLASYASYLFIANLKFERNFLNCLEVINLNNVWIAKVDFIDNGKYPSHADIFNEIMKDSRVYLTHSLNLNKNESNAIHMKLRAIFYIQMVNIGFNDNLGTSISFDTVKNITIKNLEIIESSGKQILIKIFGPCYFKLQESIFSDIYGEIINFDSESNSELEVILESSVFTNSKSLSSLVKFTEHVILLTGSILRGLDFSNNENRTIYGNSMNGYLQIYNCSFRNHSGILSMIHIEKFNSLTIQDSIFYNSSSNVLNILNLGIITTTNCTFAHSKGKIFAISGSLFIDANSTLEYNQKSILSCSNSVECKFNQTKLLKNNIEDDSMIFGNSSRISIYDSTIKENILSANLIICKDGCSLIIKDSLLQSNTARLIFLSIQSSELENFIYNTKLNSNQVKYDHFIELVNSYLKIEQSDISQNKIGGSSSIFVTKSQLKIIKTKIYEEIVEVAFLEMMLNSLLELIESQIFHINLDDSKIIIKSSMSNLIIENCDFFDISIKNGHFISSSNS